VDFKEANLITMSLDVSAFVRHEWNSIRLTLASYFQQLRQSQYGQVEAELSRLI